MSQKCMHLQFSPKFEDVIRNYLSICTGCEGDHIAVISFLIIVKKFEAAIRKDCLLGCGLRSSLRYCSSQGEHFIMFFSNRLLKHRHMEVIAAAAAAEGVLTVHTLAKTHTAKHCLSARLFSHLIFTQWFFFLLQRYHIHRAAVVSTSHSLDSLLWETLCSNGLKQSWEFPPSACPVPSSTSDALCIPSH